MNRVHICSYDYRSLGLLHSHRLYEDHLLRVISIFGLRVRALDIQLAGLNFTTVDALFSRRSAIQGVLLATMSALFICAFPSIHVSFLSNVASLTYSCGIAGLLLAAAAAKRTKGLIIGNSHILIIPCIPSRRGQFEEFGNMLASRVNSTRQEVIGAKHGTHQSQNLFSSFASDCRMVFVLANQKALKSGSSMIDAEHILFGLLMAGSDEVARLLNSSTADVMKIRKLTAALLPPDSNVLRDKKLPPTRRAKEVIINAVNEAAKLGSTYVGIEHLLLSLLHEPNGIIAEVFTASNVRYDTIRQKVIRGEKARQLGNYLL